MSRILVVEDHPVNQHLALRLLERRGYEAEVAGDGRAAIEMLKTQDFDLVLMDVEMPEMDGFQATSAIRRNEKSTGHRVPIIAMTAYTRDAVQARCVAAGMDGYLSKPVSSVDLYAVIAEVLHRFSYAALRP